MQHLAQGVTDSPLLATWLRKSFEYVLGWSLHSVVPRSPEATRGALAKGPVEAVVMDVGGSTTATLALAQFFVSEYPGLRVVALSCCGRESDELLQELVQLGLGGYLVCNAHTHHLAAQLPPALNGSYVWPAERLARLIHQPVKPEQPLADVDRTLIQLSSQGLRYKEIGAIVGLSVHTVRHRLESLRDRTGTPTTAALVAWAADHGLLADGTARNRLTAELRR